MNEPEPRRGARRGRSGNSSVVVLLTVVGVLMLSACLIGAFIAATVTK